MATVVSFYSDRDGIGRSMAVATIGWILAMNGKRVAVLDWDLRKPTLHKYLRPFIPDHAGSETGMIDVLWRYGVTARRNPPRDLKAFLQDSTEGIGCECTIPAELMLKTGGELRLIRAGAEKMRAIRVRYFNWGELVDRLEGWDAVKHFWM